MGVTYDVETVSLPDLLTQHHAPPGSTTSRLIPRIGAARSSRPSPSRANHPSRVYADYLTRRRHADPEKKAWAPQALLEGLAAPLRIFVEMTPPARLDWRVRIDPGSRARAPTRGRLDIGASARVTRIPLPGARRPGCNE